MVRGSLIVLVAAGAAACDFPTEPPRYEQTWVVPVERITIGVAELLPAGIDLSADSAAFVTETPEASIAVSLAEACGTPCVLASGLEAPKPAFRDTLRATITLPADLVSAALTGGALDATLAHDFSFDPLRPGADPDAPRGHIVIRVTSGGNTVAFDSIDGADRAFPAGVDLVPSLDVMPVEANDTVAMEIALYSPAGDSTTILATDTLGVRFAPSALLIGSATIAASGITIDSVTTRLDFGDIDATTAARVQRGALRFGVRNPFTVTGALDMVFTGDFPAIERVLAIREGDYGERLEFTGTEVRAILGSEGVEAVASGSVSAEGGTLTVAPPDALVLDSEFELVLFIGPTEEP
jgi:hypothetical protein